jgi:hypothetical protein
MFPEGGDGRFILQEAIDVLRHPQLLQQHAGLDQSRLPTKVGVSQVVSGRRFVHKAAAGAVPSAKAAQAARSSGDGRSQPIDGSLIDAQLAIRRDPPDLHIETGSLPVFSPQVAGPY